MKVLKRGTGITARRYIRLSGGSGTVGSAKGAEAPDPGTHYFESYLLDLRDFCSHVLRTSNLPDQPGVYSWEHKGQQGSMDLEGYVIKRKRNAQDSDVGYAARLLTTIDRVQAFQKEGRLLDACRWAHEVGELHREWQLKKIWDKPAIAGKSREIATRQSMKRINASKSAESRAAMNLVRAIAKEILERNPKLTRRALAKNIKAKTGLKQQVSTIESYLKNKV